MSLYDHIAQLGMLADQSDNLRIRALNCADAFNGSEVVGAAPTRETRDADPGHTLNNQFGYYIMKIQDNLNSLNSQISRIQEQVFEDTTATPKSRVDF